MIGQGGRQIGERRPCVGNGNDGRSFSVGELLDAIVSNDDGDRPSLDGPTL